MKQVKAMLLVVSCTIVMAACIKHKDATPDDSNSIVGAWELSSSQSSILPATNYPSGSGNMVVFTKNTYTVYVNHQVSKSGSYTTEADAGFEQNVCLVDTDGKFSNRIIYDGDTTPRIFIAVDGGTLSIASGCFAIDGGQEQVYKKIQQID